ncbi:MAG: hypothetical protein OEV62_04230 [Actinomycetota bacterium]|nr:hypothetical protein [Actinomycetota bacterium]MDH4352384.1 hypothetical protein [Actinomycetota bacterium]
MSEAAANPPTDKWRARHELLAVILLSVTTILTAWSAFESSKWGGAMSISFSEASSARIQAASLKGTAQQRTAVQVGLWVQWVDAVGNENPKVAKFFEQRFPEPLATAHEDWLATDPLKTDGAPSSPFAMPSYVVPETTEAAASDARADAKFATALENNQRGDNYTLLTVLFAAVLFFTAMSGRLERRSSRWTMLGFGLVLAVVGVGFLATFPKLI